MERYGKVMQDPPPVTSASDYDQYGNRVLPGDPAASDYDQYGNRVTASGDVFDNNYNDYKFVDDVYDSEDEDGRVPPFRLFESAPHYGSLNNLMFSDASVGLRKITPDDMSYKAYLGHTYGPADELPQTAIDGVRQCRVGQMTLCVTSDAELAKCVLMRTALNAQLLEPKMNCRKAPSHVSCMRHIRAGEAHVVVLDAGDVYKAGYQVSSEDFKNCFG